MKKLLYSVLALAGILAVSCNKETEAPVTPDQTKGEKVQYTIKAIYSEPDDVRTAYADDKTFSWVKGDSIFVRCIDADGEYWGWRGFEAQEGGAETTFTAELEDGWRPYDVAVYQAYHQVASVSYNDANVRVSMPISYHLDGYGLDADAGTPYYNSVAVPSTNPLSVLPLVGTAQEDGSLRFQTGVSVLKVNLTDLDATADHVAITSPDGVLGNYLMVKEGEIRISEPWCSDEGTRYATSFVEYYFTPVSDGKLSFYLPIPVGTLSKGTTLEVMDAKDNVLFKKAFTKDVEMPRNKVVELAELSTKVEWNTLGTGKFGDHYHYNANYDVDVEIQQNAADPTEFRIADPYKGYRELVEYEATGAEIGPDPYFVFRILQNGEKVNGITVTHDDLVYFDAYYTGIVDDNYGVDPFLAHPSRWGSRFTESDWLRSIVVKYQDDGVTPANIQLAPIFFWLTDPDAGSGYWSGSNYLGYNNLIEIKFPGAERIDLDASVGYLEISDDTPEQAVAIVSFEHSDVITGAKIVIAANATDAAVALADASRYTEATEAGEYEVLMPANANSGDYYVYAQTTVAAGLTPVSAQLLVSDSFKYFNANTDLGYTLDDVIGSYTCNNYYYLNGWTQATMTMTVEESDDPLNGDIMITSLCPEVIDNYGTNTFVGALYGYFNTATGEISIPAGQELAYNVNNDITWTVATYYGGDLALLLTEPGHILNEGNYAFYAGDYGKQCWTNTNTEFIRTSSSVSANKVQRAVSSDVVTMTKNVAGPATYSTPLSK